MTINVQRSPAPNRLGSSLPLPVLRALRKLGHDIRDARRRRRIPVAIAAQRASISKTTWLKVEKGNPGVLVGTYVTALFVLGLVDRVAELADPGQTRSASVLKRSSCRSASGTNARVQRARANGKDRPRLR